MQVPIKLIEGIELAPTEIAGISKVIVRNPEARKDLSWDRFVRLKTAAAAAAAAAAPAATKPHSVLDAGGYDGALGLFMPKATLDLIDPATTGGCVLNIPVVDGAYDSVMAIDVLEHIEPKDRAQALREFARVARKTVILNYPCRESQSAQELMLRLTNNQLVKEHVQWELPDSNWVLKELAKHGFHGTARGYASIAIWLGQYLTQNLIPEAAKPLNAHLIENHAEEPSSVPLYHLVVCERKVTTSKKNGASTD